MKLMYITAVSDLMPLKFTETKAWKLVISKMVLKWKKTPLKMLIERFIHWETLHNYAAKIQRKNSSKTQNYQGNN